MQAKELEQPAPATIQILEQPIRKMAIQELDALSDRACFAQSRKTALERFQINLERWTRVKVGHHNLLLHPQKLLHGYFSQTQLFTVQLPELALSHPPADIQVHC